MREKRAINLRGKTMVLIDWANVWGWRHEIGYEIDINFIDRVLSEYKEIVAKYLYFGADIHPKSIEFLEQVKELGYNLVTKPVKYQFGVRKCNFDVEMVADALDNLDRVDSFVFLSGDGDFAYLYDILLRRGKQVVIVFGKNSLGRELQDLKNLFLLDFRKFSKKYPPKRVRGPRLPKVSNMTVKKSRL